MRITTAALIAILMPFVAAVTLVIVLTSSDDSRAVPVTPDPVLTESSAARAMEEARRWKKEVCFQEKDGWYCVRYSQFHP